MTNPEHMTPAEVALVLANPDKPASWFRFRQAPAPQSVHVAPRPRPARKNSKRVHAR